MLVELNHRIRARLIDPFDVEDEQRCDFVCECGDEDCREHLLLPPMLYDDLKDNDVALLADGHPISLARQERIAARDLQETARALRAQAELQVRRAQELRVRLGQPMRVGVHPTMRYAASDLAWHLSEPAELFERHDGIEVSIEVTGSLASTLGEIRDWALRNGLGVVEVTIDGQARTLVVSG